MEDLSLGCRTDCGRRCSETDDWCVINSGASPGIVALTGDKHRWYKAYTVKDIFKVRFTTLLPFR